MKKDIEKKIEDAAREYANKNYSSPVNISSHGWAFYGGSHFGMKLERERILGLLRSDEAIDFFQSYIDSIILVSNENWADWLESKLKEK